MRVSALSGRGRRRFRWALWVVALLTLAVEPGTAAAVQPRLPPVPDPALDALEAPIREQLRERRQGLDALVAREWVPPAELGTAFGEMGQLYLVYNLRQAATACFENARALLPQDHRWPHYLGSVALEDRDLETAIRELGRATELEPADASAWIKLGRAQLDAGLLAEAEASFSTALTLAPGDAAALHGLGRVAQDRGEHREAIRRFEAALQAQPEATALYHLLGMSYRELGDLDRARESLAHYAPGPVTLHDPLVENLTTLVRGAQIHLARGNQALLAGDTETAIRELEAAVAVDPEDFLAHFDLSRAYLGAGDEDRALAALERSVELNPDYRDGRYNLAAALARAGRFAEAAVHFEAASRLDPTDADARRQWAVALARAGEPGRALEVLRTLVAQHPGDAGAHTALGTLLAQTGDLQGAREHLSQALELAPEAAVAAEAHLQLAALAGGAPGAEAEALQHLRQAAALAPERRDVHARLATALGRAGDFSGAADAFARLIALEPTSVEARFGQAMALMLGRDYPRARRELEAGLETVPGALPLAHALARLLATASDPAVRDGERALELAQRVFQQARTLDHGETVAMALAELGRFKEAAEWQRRVLAQAESSGDEALARRARRRLEGYERGEPCREPWRGG